MILRRLNIDNVRSKDFNLVIRQQCDVDLVSLSDVVQGLQRIAKRCTRIDLTTEVFGPVNDDLKVWINHKCLTRFVRYSPLAIQAHLPACLVLSPGNLPFALLPFAPILPDTIAHD